MKSEVSRSRKIPLFELDRIMSELDGRDAGAFWQK